MTLSVRVLQVTIVCDDGHYDNEEAAAELLHEEVEMLVDSLNAENVEGARRMPEGVKAFVV